MKEILHAVSAWRVLTTKKIWSIIKEILHLKYHLWVLIVNNWNSPPNYCVLFSLLSVTKNTRHSIYYKHTRTKLYKLHKSWTIIFEGVVQLVICSILVFLLKTDRFNMNFKVSFLVFFKITLLTVVSNSSLDRCNMLPQAWCFFNFYHKYGRGKDGTSVFKVASLVEFVF